MIELMNNFLLVGDKFMLERHLQQPGFAYSACGPCSKNKELMKKCKEIGNSTYVY